MKRIIFKEEKTAHVDTLDSLREPIIGIDWGDHKSFMVCTGGIFDGGKTDEWFSLTLKNLNMETLWFTKSIKEYAKQVESEGSKMYLFRDAEELAKWLIS